MSTEIQTTAAPAPDVLGAAVGELLPAPQSLLGAALGVANSQGGPLTRATSATTYRRFARYLHGRVGREPRAEDFTRDALRDYRDELERDGRAGATIAKVSALRRLAAALQLDPRIQRVKAGAATQKRPRPLAREQLDALLRAPDARTRLGKRDRAILYLMAFAGLRRSEVVRLALGDIEQVQRNDRPDRRSAIAPGPPSRARSASAWRAPSP